MRDKDRYLMVFGTALALAYITFGALEILAAFGPGRGLLERLFIQGGVMDGLVLLVIGVVMVFGRREVDGQTFVLMGMALAVVFMAIYLLLMGSHVLSLLIFGTEHVEGWAMVDGIRPGIYLGALAAVGVWVWRDRLSLGRLSRAGA